jgi:hypothetical protein
VSQAHDHGHDHGQDHGHPHSHSHENPHAGQGAVLLDIGGDVGALVVTMPRAMLGEEVELLVPDPRPHVAVVDRPTPGGAVPSLVFSELTEGRYELVPKGTDEVHLAVEVRGGEVTLADWPG